MEARDVLHGNLRQGLDLIAVGQGLLDGDLVLRAELHQEDVHDIEDKKDECLVKLDSVTKEEDGNGD